MTGSTIASAALLGCIACRFASAQHGSLDRIQFQPPVAINDYTEIKGASEPRLAVGPQGEVYAFFGAKDYRPSKPYGGYFLSFSTDGIAFTEPVEVGDVSFTGFPFSPGIAVAPAGEVVIVYKDVARVPRLRWAPPLSTSFSPALDFGEGTLMGPGPQPHVVVDGRGAIHLAWWAEPGEFAYRRSVWSPFEGPKSADSSATAGSSSQSPLLPAFGPVTIRHVFSGATSLGLWPDGTAIASVATPVTVGKMRHHVYELFRVEPSEYTGNFIPIFGGQAPFAYLVAYADENPRVLALLGHPDAREGPYFYDIDLSAHEACVPRDLGFARDGHLASYSNRPLARGPDGEICLVYVDTFGHPSVHVSVSRDDGLTWGPPQRVAGPGNYPEIIVDPSGTIHILYLEGYQTIKYVRGSLN